VPKSPLATEADYLTCRRLHRQYGTTYYFASRWFPARRRRHVDALYGFVRVADEWVDNPGAATVEETRSQLAEYRAQFLCGLKGTPPEYEVLRAFCDTVIECNIPIEEPLLFLDAMEQDLTVCRYESFNDLLLYTRGSAAAVGIMMCSVLGAPQTAEVLNAAKSLGDAMQLTNFLRDIGEDAQRGRIYVPQEDLARYGLKEADILEGKVSDRFVQFMQFQIERTRAMYRLADHGIPLLPARVRPAIKIARTLYAKILDKIEQRQYDVFSGRARTSTPEKLQAAALILVGRG
jgi:phytoene synthase